MYHAWGKRLLDLLLAMPALLLMAPLMAAVAMIVAARIGWPVLFRQERAGRDGRLFVLYKFRTMTDRRDENGELLPDADRLTRVGKWLRAASLDELPQLWNVIRGDMSLVGPRPLLPRYLPRYSPRQMRRHEVLPGITGWAQVHGRNDVAWEERLDRDVWYVDHLGFRLDVRILAMTILRVFARDGVRAQGHATMPEFTGSAPVAARPDSAVAVIGAGGHAKVVIATLEDAGYAIRAVYDDNESLWGQSLLGRPILGPVARLRETPGIAAVIAIGDSAVRARVSEELDLHWIQAVHSQAVVHESVHIGPGTVVFAGAVLQPDVTLGRHVIVNTAATVDHDSVIGDFANIGPGAHLAGGVVLGDRTDLGAGCTVIPGVHVRQDSLVGAGGTVVADLPASVVAVGCPARVLRPRSSPRAA